MAHCANLKELARLGLNTLCGINDHNGTICSHQGAVGVLGEVLVSGGVKDVDAIAIVFKLHNRRGDRNTSFLFHFHPVGNGMAVGCLTLNRACGLNSTAVKQKLFGQCCLTRVRVRNDSKRASAIDFLLQLAHCFV